MSVIRRNRAARSTLYCIAIVLGISACQTEPRGADGSDYQTVPAARAAVEEARAAMDAGDLVSALDLVSDAASLDPDSPEVLELRGMVYVDLDRLEEARFAFETLLEKYPRHPDGWLKLGNVALQQKQFQEAVEHYQQQIDVAPSEFAWYNMSLAYTELNDLSAARSALERSISVNPDYANGYAALADLSEKEGEFAEALEYARVASEKRPGEVRMKEKLGFMLLRNGQNEEAARILQSVVEEKPWDYQSRYNLGQALQRLGHASEADVQLQRAESDRDRQANLRRMERSVRTDPTNGRLHFAIGVEYQKWGRLDEALRSYQMAQGLMPDNVLVELNMATLYLHREDLDEAERRFEAIVEKDPSVGAAWLNLGFVAARKNDTERAQDAWARALAQDPSYQAAIVAFQQRLSELH